MKKKMHYRAIVISPHLDDAVFTCSGEMSRIAEEGPVLVLNIFTKFPEAVKDRGIVLGVERYEEETEASKFLNFTHHNLCELEAYFRRKEYRGLSPLFRPPLDDDMTNYVVSLRARIFSYLEQYTFDTLYIPLGIGWQVDHIITFHVFEPLIGREDILFYEDVPYALVPHATRYRLEDLGVYERSKQDKTLLPMSPLVSSIVAMYAYFKMAMMRNLKPPIMRWIGSPVVGWYFWQLIRLHRRRMKKYPPRFRLESIVMKTDNFSHKLEAMSLYSGQFKEFFTDAVDCYSHFKQYAKKITGKTEPVERYWKIHVIDNLAKDKN